MQEAARRKLDEAMVTMAYLKSQAAVRSNEHAQFMADLEASMSSHEKRMKKQEETSRALDHVWISLCPRLGS
jgi:hypothetical protein